MAANKTTAASAFLADKNNDPADLQQHLSATNRVYAKTLFFLLEEEKKRVKNRAAKLIAHLSEHVPKTVYPFIDSLMERIAGSEKILRWNALVAVGFMANVDQDKRIDAALPLLFELLKDESMITAGHAVGCLGKIALAKPSLRPVILKKLLAIDAIPRDLECSQILAGKTLAALEPFACDATPEETRTMWRFVKRYEKSPHSTVQKSALKILKRLG